MFKEQVSQRKFQLDLLDGLRGLAVLLVFLSHTSNQNVYLLPFANFSGTGKIGVFLFFVLSSFLLTFPFLRKGKAVLNKDFVLSYASRRFFRVYPLFILYLLSALITTAYLGKLLGTDRVLGIPFDLNVPEFWRHIFLQQGKSLTWSILVEFRYYFILPFVGVLYSVVLKNRIWPSFFATLALILMSQWFWPQSESLVNDPRLGPYLPVFLMGSFLAVLHYNWSQNALSEKRANQRILEYAGLLCLVILVLLIPSVASIVYREELPFDVFHKQFMLYSVLWSVVIFAGIHGLGYIRKIFELYFLRYIGFISFSMYLIHIVVRDIFLTYVPDLPFVGWLMLVVSLVLSHISFLVIEKPFSKIKYTPKTTATVSKEQVPVQNL